MSRDIEEGISKPLVMSSNFAKILIRNSADLSFAKMQTFELEINALSALFEQKNVDAPTFLDKSIRPNVVYSCSLP